MKPAGALIKRPKIITLICVLGFIWIVFTFPGMFSPETKKMGDWVPAIYGFVIALSFISFIGVWNLKRWGVEMYIGVFVAKLIFFLLTDQLNGTTYAGVVFSVWFIITFLFYYRRFDPNL